VNPGIFLNGGVSYGTWPGRCTVGMEIRLVPGMDREQLHEEVERVVAGALKGHAEYEIRYLESAQGWMPAVDLDPDSPVALAAVRAAREVLGRDVPVAAFPGGTDATYFMGIAGIPTVTSLGPGWISVAHGANEKVGVSQLSEAVQIYRRLIGNYFDESSSSSEKSGR
jgi:acetylornithine deacetylase/succinyl-diaminopimelate desuccinylase-like protein